jgi:hypothetical protein
LRHSVVPATRNQFSRETLSEAITLRSAWVRVVTLPFIL